MSKDCGHEDENVRRCNCSYPGCPRRGRGCGCLHYHRASRQLPACCFDESAEASWDRSFGHFVRCQQGG
ncbi:MAG: DUF6485 family protein [Myxococcota bacterium]|jgi:hypothetical protein|nr:DUF6485 family protein [Myxococcota bacterium]